MNRNLQKSMFATKAFLEIYYSNTFLPVTSSDNEFNKQPTKPTSTSTPKSTSAKPTLTETIEKQPKDKAKTLQKNMLPEMFQKNASIQYIQN